METQIETRTRNVKQNYRRFSTVAKIGIVNRIKNRPNGTRLRDACQKEDIDKSQYYTWLHKMEKMKSENPPITYKEELKRERDQKKGVMNKKMFVNPNRKTTHKITLSVEVGSIMELISLTNELVRTPKIKSILSVE